MSTRWRLRSGETPERRWRRTWKSPDFRPWAAVRGVAVPRRPAGGGRTAADALPVGAYVFHAFRHRRRAARPPRLRRRRPPPRSPVANRATGLAGVCHAGTAGGRRRPRSGRGTAPRNRRGRRSAAAVPELSVFALTNGKTHESHREPRRHRTGRLPTTCRLQAAAAGHPRRGGVSEQFVWRVPARGPATGLLDNPDVRSLSMSARAWLSPTRIADWSLALNYAISGTPNPGAITSSTSRSTPWRRWPFSGLSAGR